MHQMYWEENIIKSVESDYLQPVVQYSCTKMRRKRQGVNILK